MVLHTSSVWRAFRIVLFLYLIFARTVRPSQLANLGFLKRSCIALHFSLYKANNLKPINLSSVKPLFFFQDQSAALRACAKMFGTPETGGVPTSVSLIHGTPLNTPVLLLGIKSTPCILVLIHCASFQAQCGLHKTELNSALSVSPCTKSSHWGDSPALRAEK